MNDLIPVQSKQIGGTACQTVNARTLFEFLGITYQFGNWISNRIKQYSFEKNVDYGIRTKIYKKEHRGGSARRTDYTLTLDMAKELAMVERNDKGREARRYFIECEKRLLTPIALPPAPRPGQVEAVLATHSPPVLPSQTEYISLLKDKIELLELKQSTQPRRRNYTEKEKSTALRMHAEGYRNAYIAQEIGRSTSSVDTFLRHQRKVGQS